MKLKIAVLLAVVTCLSIVLSPIARADWDLILKTGSFTLSDDSQSVAGVGLMFDDSASGVFGVAGDWRWRRDVTLGGEYFQYENDWSSAIGTSGDNETGVFMFNIKKHFNVGKRVQPYVGAGIGFAGVDFKGPGGIATAEDFALQVVGGAAVRWERFGIYTELKWLSSKPEDDAGDEIDVSGIGLLAGVTIGF